MSEYWVSHKKYWCKYCEIFIADDAPSRTQHENGLRHQGNKERFIRNLYKTGQKRKQDQDEEMREVARIEQAARAAFAGDVAGGHAKGDKASSSVSAIPPSSVKSTAPRPGNVFANYTTAKDLGITEEDEAAALALKQSEGRVGQWEVVTPAPTLSGVGSSVSSTRKRPRGAAPEEDEEDVRNFKVRQKNLSRRLDDIYDPGVIVIKPKETIRQQVAEEEQSAPAPLVWQPTEWSVGPVREEGQTEKAMEAKPDLDEEDVKPIVEAPGAEMDDRPAEKTAVEVPKGGGMFKKRKVPKAGTTKQGNRRV